MAITRIQAQKLCNAAEMELVTQSLGDTLKALTAVQLRGKVKRARTLRDKFADLFRRQTVAIKAETRSKRGNTGAANERTGLKLQLFGEVLTRFETRSAQVEAQAARAAAAAEKAKAKAAKAKTRPTAKPTTKTATKPAAAPAKKRSAKAPAVKRATEVSPVVAVRGKQIGAHARSAQKRQQAKRAAR